MTQPKTIYSMEELVIMRNEIMLSNGSPQWVRGLDTLIKELENERKERQQHPHQSSDVQPIRTDVDGTQTG